MRSSSNDLGPTDQPRGHVDRSRVIRVAWTVLLLAAGLLGSLIGGTSALLTDSSTTEVRIRVPATPSPPAGEPETVAGNGPG